MNFKKRVNGSWTDTPHYIHKTDTDILTTLPDVVYVNDTTATVGLKGQMEQTGTPSPQNPIQPSECGDRTENLLATLTENYAIDASGNINSNSSFMYYTAPCEANETYTFSLDSGLSGSTVRIHAFNGDTWIEQLSGKNINLAPFTVTTPANTTNLKISITKDAKTYHTMLNVGETALPYTPCGYKIPILSANTTTPVYLGEVQTTRKIKKLVLTGEEDIVEVTSGNLYLAYDLYNAPNMAVLNIGVCTHYPYAVITSTNTNIGFAIQNRAGNTKTSLLIRWTDTTTAADFKAYLAQQYAAGTPVTVWYVLSSAITGIVNEPIRKIGDYADEVSGISIPTIAGANTISVGTTLQPSEVTVNYKGWHPVADVHKRESGQWD